MSDESKARVKKRRLGCGVELGAAVLLASACVLFLIKREPKPVSSAHQMIKVEVLNGCGETGLARRFSEFLQRRRFDVVYTGNAEAFCFTESIVLDRAGDMDRARQIARVLGIPNVIQQINTDPFRREEVTVIIGRDYDLLKSVMAEEGR